MMDYNFMDIIERKLIINGSHRKSARSFKKVIICDLYRDILLSSLTKIKHRINSYTKTDSI